MAPKRFDPAELASVLPSGGRTLVQGCSGESSILATAVMACGEKLGAMTFTGIFVPGLNRHSYLANPDCRVETFFVTPELKAAGAAVRFLPLCYADILKRLRDVRIDAALFMVTPPDENGLCSFGPVVDFLAELWPKIPVRIAHINPLMPSTRGHAGIPFEELTAFFEAGQPLPGMDDAGSDPVADSIAAHILPFVRDGVTLQTGLGKIPGAALRALKDRRGLRMHSGLIGDAVADLEQAGAFAGDGAILAGVAIGARHLYDSIGGPSYQFRPASTTHDGRTISGIGNFVSINSTLEVDLLGQAYSEVGPGGFMSGPGGASDYARAVKIADGLRIVALPSSAGRGRITRVAAPGKGAGPVSLGRMDFDVVVTEHGAADLRGRDYDERARALIDIAAPDHRADLRAAWNACARTLQSGE